MWELGYEYLGIIMGIGIWMAGCVGIGIWILGCMGIVDTWKYMYENWDMDSMGIGIWIAGSMGIGIWIRTYLELIQPKIHNCMGAVARLYGS